jgi:hypothetical protein
MKRPSFVAMLALQALLVAAAVRPESRAPDGVDQAVFRANHERWQTLPDTQRDVLRERWSRFAALPSGEQESMLQRSETLRRLSAGLEQRQGRPPTADERAAELTRVVGGVEQMLARTGPVDPEKSVTERLEFRTRRYIFKFLDNLGKRDGASPELVARLRDEPLSEQIRDTMLLLQADQLGRYSETLSPEEADKLLALSPWESAAKVERVRERAGFLGRLGSAISFTEAERAQLDAAGTPGERQEKARELKATEIRELLAAHGVATARIDELLAGPVNELEREADRVLPSAASAVVVPEPAALR